MATVAHRKQEHLMTRLIVRIVVAFILAAITISVAYAQAPTAPAANEWTPLFNNVLNVVLMAAATSVASIVVAVGAKLARKFGVEAIAQDKANMEAEILAVLKTGITKTLPEIEEKGWSSAAVRETILRQATEYMKQRFPDRVATIEAAVQPGDASRPVVSASVAVSETLAARLPEAIAAAAASPSTPPVDQAATSVLLTPQSSGPPA